MKTRGVTLNLQSETVSIHKNRGRLFYLGISTISVLIFLLVWQIGSVTNLIDPVFLPPPAQVYTALYDLFINGYKGATLLAHIIISMERLFIALFLAFIIAVPVGILAGRSKLVQAIMDPFIEFYRPLPPLAYYTLIVLWFGIGNESKIILLFMSAFAPLFIGVIYSAQKIPVDRINCAKSLGATGFQLYFNVIFRSCLPDILTSLRTAVGVSYATLVAAEMVAAVSGLGWLVLDASKYLRNDIVYAGIIIMGFIAIILDAVLRALIRKFTP